MHYNIYVIYQHPIAAPGTLRDGMEVPCDLLHFCLNGVCDAPYLHATRLHTL